MSGAPTSAAPQGRTHALQVELGPDRPLRVEVLEHLGEQVRERPVAVPLAVGRDEVPRGDVDGTQLVTGKVYPARPGRIVSVYRDGRLAAQGRGDASGVYRITTRFPSGDATLQVRTGDDTYNLGAASLAEDYTIG